MRPYFGVAAAVVVVLTTAFPQSAYAQPAASETVSEALKQLQSWIGPGENGKRWEAFLKLDELKAELAKGAGANPAVIDKVVGQLKSGTNGLELAPFVKLRAALQVWRSELSGKPLDALSQALVAAKASFKPVTQGEYDSARANLLAATGKLEEWLTKSGPNTAGWKPYLRWDEMKAQLDAGGEGKSNILREISLQYFTDHNGLELPQFTAVGKSLRTYANVLYAKRDDKLQAQYDAKLDELGPLLATYTADTTEAGAAAVDSYLAWLERNGQGGKVLDVVRDRFTRPNLFVHASEELIAYGLRRDINEMTPLQDVILGTTIRGTGHTIGKIDARLVPDTSRSVIDLSLTGNTSSKTVGSNRSALVYVTGVTRISGTKRIWLDESGVHSTPSYADANTNSRITGVGSTKSGIAGCLVTKIASKKAGESKGQAQEIGSQHAEARIRRRLDEEAASQLATSNRDWKLRMRDPLTRSNVYPQLMKFTSTDDALNLVVLEASMTQLGAPSAPPKLDAKHDLSVVVHQSIVNNVAATMFAGRTLTDEMIRAEIIKRRGSLPDEMKNNEDQEPFSFTFADEQPVSFQIEDGGFRVTMRGKRFSSGERKFKAMNISATYRAERNGPGLKLVRQGDLEIFPPGFNRATDKFPIDQVALRSILQKKFGKMFKPEIVTEGLELPGKYKSLGKIPLAEYQLAKGWASLGWDKTAGRVATEKTGSKLSR